jgi:hypothetical protein
VNEIEPAGGLPAYIIAMHRYARTKSATMTARGFLGMLCLTAAAGGVHAGQIYKSVDANGNVVYSDHLDSSMSQSTVVQLEDPGLPPHELHFCWTNCFTLILEDGVYRRTDGTDESWTVETFSRQAIVLHRHDAPADWNGFSQDVTYAGQVANDRLIGVTVNGKPTSGVDASWGDALNTLPGSNAERDAIGTAQPNAQPNTLPSDTVSTATTPPPLQAEEQPSLAEDGYLWTPGYWSWRNTRYVWISGAWVRPPHVGLLWTPPYWASAGSVFVFHPGHWGPTVGFYGGVNYGHGYFGNGYSGGHWIGNSFAYNSAINHVNPAVAHHSFNQPTTAAIQRTRPPTSNVVEPNRPAAVVTKPAPGVPERFHRVTPPRAAPVKQVEQR